MQVKLNIMEDAELRVNVREIVNGQIKAILKDDFAKLVQERIVMIDKHINILINDAIRTKIQSTWTDENIRKHIDDAIKSYWGLDKKIKDDIQNAVKEYLLSKFACSNEPERLKEMIDKATKEIIKDAMRK